MPTSRKPNVLAPASLSLHDLAAMLQATLTALQTGASTRPALFPHGINKISIDIKLPGSVEASLLIEGPETANLAEVPSVVAIQMKDEGTLGCDTSTSTINQVSCLKGAVTFVARYLARSGTKVITRAEALALKKAGIRLVSVWEDGSPTKPAYFSKAKGEADGRDAYVQAEKLGQPKTSPIYFAVDYNASLSDVNGAVANYFDGVAAGFAGAASSSVGTYSVGVYGSGRTCRVVKSAGRADYSWLAQSTGWAEHATYKDWNIKQLEGRTLCDISIDGDIAVADFGGYLVT